MVTETDILGTITFLLPVITLFIGFLILKWDALRVALAAWIVEVIVVLVAYPEASIMRATVWANFDLWTGYAVLWTGFVFRMMYTNTGLLQRLIDVLGSLFKHNLGKALTLSAVIGGLIGAFNGFATYPITIAGIKELKYEPWRAATGYLVYFAWMVPFVSLWIGATIAQVGSHVPIVQLAPVIGVLSIPLVFLSTFGFARILKIPFKDEHNMQLLLLSIAGALLAIIIFTIIIPQFYLLTLIASSIFIMALLLAYSRSRKLYGEMPQGITKWGMIRPFMPIVIGIVLILVWGIPQVKAFLANFAFTLNLWGFSPISINLLDNPGFYIFVIALSSYLFLIPPSDPKQKRSNPARDIALASKMSWKTLLTLFFGGGMVGIMISAGQIEAVRNVLVTLGTMGYGVVLVVFSWVAGVVFAQGIPADLLLSHMQIGVEAAVGLPLAFAVAIVALVVMGPANPLKPSLLSYTAVIAGAPEEDHPKMFRTALIWQLAAMVIIVVEVAIAIALFF
jgi:lactate permease